MTTSSLSRKEEDIKNIIIGGVSFTCNYIIHIVSFGRKESYETNEKLLTHNQERRFAYLTYRRYMKRSK